MSATLNQCPLNAGLSFLHECGTKMCIFSRYFKNWTENFFLKINCKADRECTQNQFCDLHYQQCRQLRKADELCRSDRHCIEGFDCMYGRCLPHVKFGLEGSRRLISRELVSVHDFTDLRRALHGCSRLFPEVLLRTTARWTSLQAEACDWSTLLHSGRWTGVLTEWNVPMWRWTGL